ncbi:hypothetical protein [Sediminicola luteus]|uniref:Peptidase S74 domain-containing protein n=1 Tax=Sediminicola luteus TaxID=319238 RepID=A0A2A4G659_9FLAO|nr:hypothetical protein [Sediminicola luteus]PCE63444.1 hypothetical protein B7P33_14625 [Sediminicola luteus]
MKIKGLTICIFVGFLHCTWGQIKIGENPQQLHPASVLELESTDRALIIPRVDQSQMEAITPLAGALVYNTTAGGVYYFEGRSWINLGSDNQQLRLNQNLLTLEDGGQPIDISTLLTNTGNNQNLGPAVLTKETLQLTIENGEGVRIDLSDFALDTDLSGFLTEELDDDPTNELELPDDSAATNGDVLTTDGDGNYSWATPTSGGGTDTNDFVSAGNLNDQNLILTGTGTAGATIDLSPFALDTDLTGFLIEELDDDPTNELELPDDSAATNGDVLVTDGDGNYSWATPTSGGETDTNDFISAGNLNDQNLILTGTGTAGATIDLSAFALDTDLTGFLIEELDDDPTNELELPDDSAATNGDVLITDGNGNYNWATPTSGGGTDTNDFVSAGNLNGQNLVLTGTGTAGATIDLSPFALDTDLTGFLTEELDDDPTNELELPDDSAATNGDVLITDGDGNYSWTTPNAGSTDTNDFVSAGNLNGQNLVLTGSGTAGASIDLSPFALDSDLSGFLTIEVDGDTTNELQNANEVPITDSANHFTAENVETALAELAANTGNMASTDLVLNTAREHDLAGNNLVFSGAGNVGIGNLPGAPQNKLDVSGQIRARNGFASTGGTANNPGYGFYTNNDSNTGMFRAAADQIGLTTGGTEAIRIDNSQNVGIGTDNPAEKLHVVGNILASGTITPDYVFEKYFTGYSALKPTYKMLNLFELEQYIKKHLHLPGMPSAKKVEQQGGLRINLATERNLEKIEELYLHTISQHKKIMELQKKNQRNELELRILKSELQALKSYVLTMDTKNE